MNKLLLVSIPFMSTGFLASTAIANDPYLQYGALSLCAISVGYICVQSSKSAEYHRQERKELVASLQAKEAENTQLLRQCIESYNRLSDLLQDRPCLMSDTRIK